MAVRAFLLAVHAVCRMLPESNTSLQKGDEVVIIAHRKALPELETRWNPKPQEATEKP